MLAKRSTLEVFKKHYEALMSWMTVEIIVVVVSEES